MSRTSATKITYATLIFEALYVLHDSLVASLLRLLQSFGLVSPLIPPVYLLSAPQHLYFLIPRLHVFVV